MEPVFPPSSIGFEPNSSSPIERAGRDGALRLGFERRRGQTVLAERRFTLPLQALDAVPLDGAGSVCLMLLNPTGGLVGGDHLKTEIALGPDTHVCLTTPSATKVYRTLGPPAIQETAITIGEGAILEYVPDHVIPHPGSVYHQSLTVEMSPSSRAITVDAFAIGRLARGERWRFAEMDNRIAVSSLGQPLFLDRMRLDPSSQTLTALGAMESFGYLATVCLFADGVEDWESIVRSLQEELFKSPSIRGAASPLSRGGCVVRLMAHSAPDLTQAVRNIWTLARRLLLGLPAVDLRKW
jgi:urease accessory protein